MPPRAEYIRVITSELNRISSHLVWWGAFLLDLGGFTPLLYAFDDREKILDLLERHHRRRGSLIAITVSAGSTMMSMTISSTARASSSSTCGRGCDMYRDLVTDNIILRKRLKDIGPISAEMCRKYGATGPVIRGSGVPYDVRRAEPYSVYPDSILIIPLLHGRRLHGPLPGAHGGDSRKACASSSRPWTNCPSGPVHGRKVPRVLKLPAGDYYYAVEAARGRFWCASSATARKSPTG